MRLKAALSAALVVALSACASTPKDYLALERARAAVQAAEADLNVNLYAASSLQAAQRDLRIAEAAAQRDQDLSLARAAKLATQNARLAQLRGTSMADQAMAGADPAQVDSIKLAERTPDADSAKSTAAGPGLWTSLIQP